MLSKLWKRSEPTRNQAPRQRERPCGGCIYKRDVCPVCSLPVAEPELFSAGPRHQEGERCPPWEAIETLKTPTTEMCSRCGEAEAEHKEKEKKKEKKEKKQHKQTKKRKASDMSAKN
jgi:hypothetical protein